MTAKSLIGPATALAMSLSIAWAPLAAAQAGESLGTVRLTRSVMADGKPLPAGTYTVRVSNDAVPRVPGISPEASTWVEFVQDGQVRGRELATVVPPADVKEVAKGTPPAPGTARVQVLTGGEYLRVWLNRAGTQYLIHFSTTK